MGDPRQLHQNQYLMGRTTKDRARTPLTLALRRPDGVWRPTDSGEMSTCKHPTHGSKNRRPPTHFMNFASCGWTPEDFLVKEYTPLHWSSTVSSKTPHHSP